MSASPLAFTLTIVMLASRVTVNIPRKGYLLRHKQKEIMVPTAKLVAFQLIKISKKCDDFVYSSPCKVKTLTVCLGAAASSVLLDLLRYLSSSYVIAPIIISEYFISVDLAIGWSLFYCGSLLFSFRFIRLFP